MQDRRTPQTAVESCNTSTEHHRQHIHLTSVACSQACSLRCITCQQHIPSEVLSGPVNGAGCLTTSSGDYSSNHLCIYAVPALRRSHVDQHLTYRDMCANSKQWYQLHLCSSRIFTLPVCFKQPLSGDMDDVQCKHVRIGVVLVTRR